MTCTHRVASNAILRCWLASGRIRRKNHFSGRVIVTADVHGGTASHNPLQAKKQTAVPARLL